MLQSSLDFLELARPHFQPIQVDISLAMMSTAGAIMGYLTLKVAVTQSVLISRVKKSLKFMMRFALEVYLRMLFTIPQPVTWSTPIKV